MQETGGALVVCGQKPFKAIQSHSKPFVCFLYSGCEGLPVAPSVSSTYEIEKPWLDSCQTGKYSQSVKEIAAPKACLFSPCK